MDRVRSALEREFSLSARPGLWLKCVALIGLLVLLALPEHGHSTPAEAWGRWSLMVTAMMLPVVAPVVSRLAAAGLWARRRRTAAEFTGAYLAAWVAAGLVTVQVSAAVPHHLLTLVTAVGLIVAAAWHVSPPRRRLLRRCGSVLPVPLSGWSASTGCFERGWSAGARAIAACGPGMAAMAFSHGMLLMAGLAAVLWSEYHRGPNPVERAAHPLQAMGLLTLAGASFASSWA